MFIFFLWSPLVRRNLSNHLLWYIGETGDINIGIVWVHIQYAWGHQLAASIESVWLEIVHGTLNDQMLHLS